MLRVNDHLGSVDGELWIVDGGLRVYPRRLVIFLRPVQESE
jgi:hypothetical protein